MIKVQVIGTVVLMLAVGSAFADARPGTARRDFRGKTFYYEPITYYSPVWYKGDGIVATRKLNGVPLWPEGQFNVVYK